MTSEAIVHDLGHQSAQVSILLNATVVGNESPTFKAIHKVSRVIFMTLEQRNSLAEYNIADKVL